MLKGEDLLQYTFALGAIAIATTKVIYSEELFREGFYWGLATAIIMAYVISITVLIIKRKE